MYYSSLSFFIPLILLNLPNFINISILSLLVSSLLYHNYPSKILKFIDYSNIINLSSNIYFHNYYYSFFFIFVYFIEFILYKTHHTKNIIYFLAYSKYSNFFSVNFFFFSSLLVYITHIIKNEFTQLQRWLWHFGQAMFIYSSLSTQYK